MRGGLVNISLKTLLKTTVAACALFTGGILTADAEETQLLWGDTHLHTKLSSDAYLLQNRSATPDDSYNYAKGLPIIHPYHKARIQIGTPLDFLVVTDHAEFMGVVPRIVDGDPLLLQTETGARYYQMANEGKLMEIFGELITQVNRGVADPALVSEELNRSVWSEIVDAAERHNDPGKFTAFIGWEWSSLPNGANLHRVIFMPEGEDVADQFLPYTSFDSTHPEDLWAWLAATSEEVGANFVAIPHNSNISQGLMFPVDDKEGRPIGASYANMRMRWEPAVEIVQIKGDSETHPTLSPNDEFADFETYEHIIAVGEFAKEIEADKGDYVRSGLLRGLEIGNQVGVNPYKFAITGSTDSHTGASSAEENNFHGKMALDSTPQTKSAEIIPGALGWDMSAAGLAAVWATENTREAITEAFKRKEIYGTSGPRIKLRFFGGWDFEAGDADARDVAAIGYAKGVPMGGDLTNPPEKDDGAVVGFFKEVIGQDKPPAPSFLIHAVKDPVEGNLDRVQVVKGWLDADGVSREKVYNVAWSGEREIDENGKLLPVGNTVDIKTGFYYNSIGTAQLSVVWSDPDFDAGQSAFYYVRVIQIPTPRHTLFDAIALGIDVEETGHPATIQERAYSSPIWYTPSE